MGDGEDNPNLVPRLCHIVRWSDFNGYGFNLHAEKGKAGQFIGKVDEGSPAEAAGLKQGDRIVEVNGTNIGNENHQQVVGRIKAGGDETRLLVVDNETDQYYKNEKKMIRGDLTEVKFLTAVREAQQFEQISKSAEAEERPSSISNDTNGDADDAVADAGDASSLSDESQFYRPRLCHLCKWADFDGYGFNLHAEKDKPGQFIGSVDADSPAVLGGLKEHDRIIEVNGENIEKQTHAAVIQKIKAGGDRTSLLVVDRAADEYYKERGETVSSSMSHVVVFTTPAREEGVLEENVTEPSLKAAFTNDLDSPKRTDQTSEEQGQFAHSGVDVSLLPDPNVSLSDDEETVTAAFSEPVESTPDLESVQNGSPLEATSRATEDAAEGVAAVSVDDDEVVVKVTAPEEDASRERVDVNTYEEIDITHGNDEDLGSVELTASSALLTGIYQQHEHSADIFTMVPQSASRAPDSPHLLEEQVDVAVAVAAGPPALVMEGGSIVAEEPYQEARGDTEEREAASVAAAQFEMQADAAKQAEHEAEDEQPDDEKSHTALPEDGRNKLVTTEASDEERVPVETPEEMVSGEVTRSPGEQRSESPINETEKTVLEPPLLPSNGSASNGINGGVEERVPEPAYEPSPVRSEPEPAVIGSTTKTTAGSDGLNLDISAAEMKERLRSRKKQDPRTQKTSFETKHKMFERM